MTKCLPILKLQYDKRKPQIKQNIFYEIHGTFTKHLILISISFKTTISWSYQYLLKHAQRD